MLWNFYGMLRKAVENGALEFIKKILEHGLNLDNNDLYSSQPLKYVTCEEVIKKSTFSIKEVY